MRIVDIWKHKKTPTVSFELFPARDPKAASKLESVIADLTAIEPDFVSVTFGAGGSTRDGSRKLVADLLKGRGLDVIAYFACWGLGPDDIAAVLDDYRALGVENLLAVRGDPPREEGARAPHPQALAHASDLVALVSGRWDFCLGCAGYPEGHVEAASREKDLDYLKLKVDSGAEYVITNYFYDNACYFGFVERCRKAGITVPILPGVMPVFSVKMMETLASLCGATITPALRSGLGALPPEDKDAVVRFGIDFAHEQCLSLVKAGVPGLHFYTMDRSRSAVEIVRRLREARVV